jgi:hypothetical protein
MSSIAIVGLGRVFETAIAFVQHLQLGISDLPGCIFFLVFFKLNFRFNGVKLVLKTIKIP